MTSREVFRVPRRLLWLIVSVGIVQAVSLVAMLLLLRAVVDHMVGTPGDVSGTVFYLALMGADALLYGLLRWAEFALAEKLGYQTVQRLRMEMYGHLSRMAPRQLQHRSRGALLLRFTGDLTMLRMWISRGFTRGIVAAVVFLLGFAIISYFSGWMALVLAAILLMTSALSLSLGASLRRLTRSVRRKRSLLTSNVDEQLAALATVQAFGRTRGETYRLSRQNDSLTRTLIREARVRALLRAIAGGASWLAVVAVLAVGAIQVGAGRLSIGSVVAAMFLVRQMSISTRNVALAHDYWQRAQVSKAKILDFLSSSSRPVETTGVSRLRIRSGKIEFRGATVKGALVDVDGVVEPGQIIAVMGSTGAGKSTLLATVARLAELDAGSVLIDEQDVALCSLRSVHRQVGVVSPDLPLMRGTVQRNVTYRLPNVDRSELDRQIAAWGLDEALEVHSGIDTWLTERGSNLSRGERQLIALARAWIGNPRILVLDDPTEALDDAGKRLFRRLVARHHGTVLFSTHDPLDASLADRVWHLEAGRIVQQTSGTQYLVEHTREQRQSWPA